MHKQGVPFQYFILGVFFVPVSTRHSTVMAPLLFVFFEFCFRRRPRPRELYSRGEKGTNVVLIRMNSNFLPIFSLFKQFCLAEGRLFPFESLLAVLARLCPATWS